MEDIHGNPKRNQPFASLIIVVLIVAIIIVEVLLLLKVIHADKILS